MTYTHNDDEMVVDTFRKSLRERTSCRKVRVN